MKRFILVCSFVLIQKIQKIKADEKQLKPFVLSSAKNELPACGVSDKFFALNAFALRFLNAVFHMPERIKNKTGNGEKMCIAVKLDKALVIESEIAKLKRQLREAKRSGKPRTAKKLREKLNALCLWLDSV